MVVNCVAYGCNNTHDNSKDIPYHSFPFKRPEILKLWIKAIRRANWSPSKTSRICGEHFLPSDYQERAGLNNLRYLKADAVPSVFSYNKLATPRRELAKSGVRKEKPPRDNSDMYRQKKSVPSTSFNATAESSEILVLDSDEEPNQDQLSLSSDTETISDIEENGTEPTKSWAAAKTKRFLGEFQAKDMEDPDLAKQFWHVAHRRMDDYKKKIRMLQQYSRRLNNKIAYQKVLLKMTKDEDSPHMTQVLPEAREAVKKKTIWVIKCGV